MIPPFDHPDVIAGQGTVGLEIARQLADTGLRPDAVLIPCSGGGLAAGCGLALRQAIPDVALYAVEPAGFDDTRLSLEAGRRVTIAPGSSGFCDALLLTTPGALTFEINRRQLDGALVVDDTAVRHAMRVAAREFRVILEPGGAVALAAVLSGQWEAAGRTVVAIGSGGNTDPAVLASCLAADGRA